jgi:hypothetical protein
LIKAGMSKLAVCIRAVVFARPPNRYIVDGFNVLKVHPQDVTTTPNCLVPRLVPVRLFAIRCSA